MPKREILANEELFNSWNDLRHDMERLIDHGRSIVQNDLLLSHRDITAYLLESEESADALINKIYQLQNATRDYLQGLSK